MRGRGFSFHGPVNSGEAGGHRSKLKVVLAQGGHMHRQLIAVTMIILSHVVAFEDKQ